jgi:hypothetical protein
VTGVQFDSDVQLEIGDRIRIEVGEYFKRILENVVCWSKLVTVSTHLI